jgi:hypothetical protein
MTKKNSNIFNKDFVFEVTDQFGELIESKKVRIYFNSTKDN